jgi:hypothetical protein
VTQSHFPYRWSDREKYVLKIKPNRANDIYIVDYALYDKRRAEITVTLGERNSFTNAEVGDMHRAAARTLIPIAEYKGGFEKPVVLIDRELSFDEVEIVSGPHKDSFDR